MSVVKVPEPNEGFDEPVEVDWKQLAVFVKRIRSIRSIRYPLTLAFLSTIITFAFGCCAYLVFQDKGPAAGWLALWNRWDAVHYLRVAEFWYGGESSGDQRFMIVFFPLYPFSIFLVHSLIRNWHVAALVVSNICCAGAFCYFFLLSQKEYGREAAKVAVFYFSIFPTAYFLHVAYSESLFLFLTIGAFYYARQGRWLPCALLGMLSTSCRLPGLAIILPLAVEYLQQKEFRWRRIRWDAALLALVPLGLVVYLFLNYYYFGNPLKFLQYQREHWDRSLSLPTAALKNIWYWLNHDTSFEHRVMVYGWQLVVFVLGTIGLIIAAFRLRPCYTVYLALSWVLIFCDSLMVCAPRYMLTQFPFFMLMAQWRRRDWFHYSVICLFLLFYAMNVTQFARGWWAH
jgi:hypothetical protein